MPDDLKSKPKYHLATTRATAEERAWFILAADRIGISVDELVHYAIRYYSRKHRMGKAYPAIKPCDLATEKAQREGTDLFEQDLLTYSALGMGEDNG